VVIKNFKPIQNTKIKVKITKYRMATASQNFWIRKLNLVKQKKTLIKIITKARKRIGRGPQFHWSAAPEILVYR
jgi:hypothetical protein